MVAVPVRIIGIAGVMMVTAALPMQYSDTAVVGSTLREVYAEPPADMIVAASSHSSKHYGNGKEGKAGKGKKSYRRRQSSSGDDGYSHYDEFHTKQGDKYGFEKHTAYGKGKKGSAAGAFHDDQGGEASDNKEILLYDAAYLAPRSQSLHDLGKDAFQLSDNRQRKQLHDDDGDLFFMFGGGDSYVAADGSDASDEKGDQGEHEGDDGGDHEEGDDIDDDHQDEESAPQEKKKKGEEDDSSEQADYDE